MEQETRTAKFLKQRKFLTVLPLLVIPFLTVFFVLLGGGRNTDAQAASADLAGFNKDIPTAVVEEQVLDKMKYYELAEKDAAALLEQQKNDPYYTGPDINEYASAEDSANKLGNGTGGNVNTSVYAGRHGDAPENKVLERLEKLNAALKAPEPEPAAPAVSYTQNEGTVAVSKDMEKLEVMMQRMQQGNDTEDPEMQQINGMLERILDIQHPERIQEQMRKTSEQRKGQVFSVSPYKDSAVISSLSASQDKSLTGAKQHNGFFSLNDEPAITDVRNAIEAVIHESQILTSGATVKLRLMNDIFINGVRIPKDHFIFGTASLNGERLEIAIDHIRYEASLFPVTMWVHDMDGMSGIYIPGAITRDVMKQSGDQSLQGLGMVSMNPSLGVQAASAGIELGRNLLSKKIKLVKVQVKAGYKVLLLDQKQQRNNN